MMYESFASIYDRLMDDFDYDAWSRYYLRILEDAGYAGGDVCECGCGTGNMTLRLARAGLRVTACDLSPDMLMIAQAKDRKSVLRIPFIQQDMRRLALHRPVDAVLACCDAVNYLTSEADVKAFLRRVWSSLRPGGVIAFDMSSPAKLLPMADGFYGGRRKYNALNAQSRDDRERNGDGAFAEAGNILFFSFRFPLVCFLYVSVTLFVRLLL